MDLLRRKTRSASFSPGRGVDIERILLENFRIEADYRYLPDRVLGQTLFSSDGRTTVVISRELSDYAEHYRGHARRFRSTLAHEIAHVALHTQLCVVRKKNASGPNAHCQAVMCRDGAIFPDKSRQEQCVRHSNDWWEYQANAGMSALLLPFDLVQIEIDDVLDYERYLSIRDLIRAGKGNKLVDHLSWAFNVSIQMVQIRVAKMETTVPN